MIYKEDYIREIQDLYEDCINIDIYIMVLDSNFNDGVKDEEMDVYHPYNLMDVVFCMVYSCLIVCT